MKRLLLIFLTLLLCGCTQTSPEALPPSSAVTSESIDEAAPESAWGELLDLQGNNVDFDDVKIIEVDYAIGWNFDTPGYQRIEPGDTVGGFEVLAVESNYYIERIQGEYASAVCNQNQYYLDVEFPIQGILAFDRTTGEVGLYPLHDEQRGKFLFVCERNEAAERNFALLSSISLEDGTQVKVQPIRMSCTIPTASGNTPLNEAQLRAAGVSLPETAAADLPPQASDERPLPGTPDDKLYLPCEIKFSVITVWAFSDGEGAGIYGTRAIAYVEDILSIDGAPVEW